VADAGFFEEVLMSTFTNFLRTVAFSAALGAALTVAPVAYAAGVGGGSHGGFAGGGSHGGGFHGGGFHGGVGMHGGGFHGGGFHGGGFRGGVALNNGFHRGHWHGRYDGYWQDGAWVDGWSPYCDPNSPLYNLNYCYDY
jgi:uncharacterized membrane protein